MSDGARDNGDHGTPPADEAALSARLKRLGERLGQRTGRPAGDSQGPASVSDRSAMARGLRLSSELIGGVIGGVIIGVLFDRWLGTAPWGLIVFFLLGFAAGMLGVMRTAGLIARTNGPQDNQ